MSEHVTELVTVSTPGGAVLQPAAPMPADCNPALVYLAGLGPRSRRVMRGDLDTIAAILSSGRADAARLPWAALRFQHTAAIRAQLADSGRAPATVNRMLCAMRGAMRAAWRLGQMPAEEYHRAADLPPMPGKRDEPRGRALTTGEKRALLDACARDDTPAGFRDAAMLALALGAGGLRRAELVGLDLADVGLTPDAGAKLTVHGKGNKTRTVPVTGGAWAALADWLTVRGDAPGPLFWPVNRGGAMTPARLSAGAVYAMTEKRAREAAIGAFSPHDLRRTFVSDLLDAGADIATVQKLAGHESVDTTARYDRRGERAKRAAVDRLHIPYTRRRLDA